jgi:dTDP-4-dehydrorhamnose reductase
LKRVRWSSLLRANSDVVTGRIFPRKSDVSVQSQILGAKAQLGRKTMLHLSGERDELRVLADQRGCPMATIDIARALLAAEPAARSGTCGLGHLSFCRHGRDDVVRFAREIVRTAAGARGRSVPVLPIDTKDHPTPAKRSADSELDSSRLSRHTAIRVRPRRRGQAGVEAVLVPEEAR